MSNPTIQIPQDVIQPIIQANISAAITQAMGDRTGVVNKVIEQILNVRVDGDGKIDTYSSNRSMSWVDWAVGNALRTAAKEAINQAIAEQQDVIKQHIATQLQRKNSPLIKQLVEGMMTGVFDASKCNYRLNVTHESTR